MLYLLDITEFDIIYQWLFNRLCHVTSINTIYKKIELLDYTSMNERESKSKLGLYTKCKEQNFSYIFNLKTIQLVNLWLWCSTAMQHLTQHVSLEPT